MSLNEAQKRSVSVTMVLVDQALSRCERLLIPGGEQGLLYSIEDDLSSAQKAALLRLIQEIRQILSQLDARFRLAHDGSTVTREISGHLTYLWTILQECASRRLQGYGAVAESLQADLDPRLVQLISLIRAMEGTMGCQTEVIRVR